ncbi:MAG: hypothetical protein ABS76_18600 [Pelagibacterium sp. SCN 64-44]|nr:MAG: hypothetical protein ABS76_18600 [Pelagibacterium sp. SCN 64-44]
MIARFGIAFVFLVVATPPGAAEPFHHPFGEWREYNRDWLAACPDAIDEDAADYYGFACFASTGSAELNAAGQPAYKLTLVHNRLTGARDVALSVAANGAMVDEKCPLLMAFGSAKPERFDFSADLEIRYAAANQYFIADPSRSAAVLAAMMERNAVTLSIPMQGEAAPRVVKLSLRGVSASLDFMATYARRVAQY